MDGVDGVEPPQHEADTLYPFVVEGTDGVPHPPLVVLVVDPQDVVPVLLEINWGGLTVLSYISVSLDAEHEYENLVLDEVVVPVTHMSCLRLSSLFSECRT